MKTENPEQAASAEPLDPRVLALARALGRYQALRDMAAARASAPADNVEDADDRAWPAAPAKPRVIDLYSLATPSGFLPGFVAYASAAGAFPAAFHRR